MTKAKERKKVGRSLKRTYGLKHVLAMQLAKYVVRYGGSYASALHFAEAQVTPLLQRSNMRMVFEFEACCLDTSHGDVVSSVRFEEV